MCAALDALWEVDRAERGRGTAAQVVAGLCWLVGRANGRVGTGTAVTQAVLKGDLGLRVSPGSRATRFRERLRDLRPPAQPRPMQCPDLLELGRADVLLSSTRRDLVRLRDRALGRGDRGGGRRARPREHLASLTCVTVKVGVLGALGKVGRAVCDAVEAEDDLELVGARRRRRRPAGCWWTPGSRRSSTSPTPTW